MSRNIIKTCTAYLLFLYSFAYAVSAYSANNSIYITQSGGSSALTMNIDQIGNSNVVGTSQARATLSGTSMVVDVDQIGDSNDIDTTQTGNANHSITADITGNTNNIDIDQTNSGGSTSGIVDIVAVTTGGVIDIDQCTSGC